MTLSPGSKGVIPTGKTPKIITRRGCDLNPLDITDPDHRARLMAYIWPDQPSRMARTQAAIDIALKHPLTWTRPMRLIGWRTWFLRMQNQARCEYCSTPLLFSISPRTPKQELQRRWNRRATQQKRHHWRGWRLSKWKVGAYPDAPAMAWG